MKNVSLFIWGDAFDLFVYFEHGGDFNQAVKAAGEMFTTTDQANGQVISITKANQREYMRQQNALEQDFQGGQTKPTEQAWESPIPLDENLPPAMNPDILHGPVGDMARAVSLETETPIELSIGTGLSVLATAIQGKIIIKIKPGYQEPLNIWSNLRKYRFSLKHGRRTLHRNTWEHSWQDTMNV